MCAENTFNKRLGHTAIIRLLLKAVPVSIQPRILTIKNRYLSGIRKIAPSDLFAAGVTTILILSLYLAIRSSLNDLSAAGNAIDISGGGSPISSLIIKQLVHLLSISLFLLIAISSTVTGIHELFLTHDLERLLSSPIRRSAFLAGKALSVLVSTSWMIAIFSIAPLIALGVHLKAGTLYYICTPILGLLYLILAVQIGLISSIILATLLPARLGRALISIVFISTILALLSFTITPNNTTQHGLLLLLNQPLSDDNKALLTVITSNLIPSNWLASSLSGLLDGSHNLAELFSTTLLLSAANAIAWGILLATFKGLYSTAHNKLYSGNSSFRGNSYRLRPTKWVRHYIPSRLQSVIAIALKELYTFSRDLTHLVQLAIFLTISLLYFINFQNLPAPKHVGTGFLRAWDLVTASSFIVLSSLIILSICARFVFPSISLEGESLWMLQVAPITVSEVVRAKLITWLLPVSFICSVLFASAGLALAFHPMLVITMAIYGVITAYGLVGLAMRLGTRFARFDWEHRGELTSSLGSLIYVILGLISVALILTPLLFVLGLYIFIPASFDSAASLGVLLVAGVTVGAVMAWISARQRCSLW